MSGPLQGYTSVEESDPFVIGADDEDDEQEIELPITDKSEMAASTEQTVAGTV